MSSRVPRRGLYRSYQMYTKISGGLRLRVRRCCHYLNNGESIRMEIRECNGSMEYVVVWAGHQMQRPEK